MVQIQHVYKLLAENLGSSFFEGSHWSLRKQFDFLLDFAKHFPVNPDMVLGAYQKELNRAELRVHEDEKN